MHCCGRCRRCGIVKRVSRRLAWTRTADGWPAGDYRIHLVAPRIWMLVEGQEHNRSDHRSVLAIAPSARWLRSVAERTEVRRVRVRVIASRAAAAVGATAVAPAVMDLGDLAAIPVGVVLLVLYVRAAVAAAVLWTDAAWSRLSETYQ